MDADFLILKKYYFRVTMSGMQLGLSATDSMNGIPKKIEKKKVEVKLRRLRPDTTGSKVVKLSRRRRLTAKKSPKMEDIVTGKREASNNDVKVSVDLVDNLIDGRQRIKLKKPMRLTKKLKEEVDSLRTKEVEKKSSKPRCLARIANGEQCRRSRTDSDELCSCHRKHCPYGKIDGPLQGKFISVPRKRGPKIRNQKDYKLDELPPELYQQTEVIKVDSELYLIDQFGLLFKNDSSCEIVGRRMHDEIHWYI